MTTFARTKDPESLKNYRDLILQMLDRRIEHEREARDPDGIVLGLQEAYRLIAGPEGPVEGSKSRHPSSRANPPGREVLSGSYGPGRVIEDGIPAVITAMLQSAQSGRTVRVSVQEVSGS